MRITLEVLELVGSVARYLTSAVVALLRVPAQLPVGVQSTFIHAHRTRMVSLYRVLFYVHVPQLWHAVCARANT